MFFQLLYALQVLLFGQSPNSGLEKFTPMNCVPNKTFIYDHNICYCNDKGTNITCKRKMYSTLYAELQANLLQNLTLKRCSEEIPRKNIIDTGCHKCVCTDDKHATCVPSTCTNDTINHILKCIPGSILSDTCNGCICGPDGTATCTNLNCFEIQLIKNPYDIVCVPKSDFFFGCNSCGCNDSGSSISCEKVQCEKPTLRHKHVLNVTVNCQPTSIFDYGKCHKCKCSRSGTYAICNGIDCRGSEYDMEEEEIIDTVEKCNPGMIFANDCNICICNKFGKGICTTMKCDIGYTFKYVKQLR